MRETVPAISASKPPEIPEFRRRRNVSSRGFVRTIELLRTRGWTISDAALHDGLAAARWPGRFELLLRHGPVFIADGGHNPDCAAALAAALREHFPGRRFVFLVGVMADKDYPTMLATVLPLAERFVAVRPVLL